MESSKFESIAPLRFISYTLPNPTISNLDSYFHTEHIRIAVLDSSSKPANPPVIAAMLVPKNRETDWTFTTEAGHFQLLSGAPGVSRLILVGNNPSNDESGTMYEMPDDGIDLCTLDLLEDSLYPLVSFFLTKMNRELGRSEVPFLRFEDNVVKSMVLEKTVGPIVGDILIEDVEIEGSEREFRRRLRFKRMPNLVQSEINIVPIDNSASFFDMKFQPDLGSLVHVYLPPMVASLSFISVHLQDCLDSGIKPRALCFGVGGGALIGFLSTQLGFDVTGVEIDEVVLTIAKQYFGLEQCESVSLIVGDGIAFLKNAECIKTNRFDVIMVDLDPNDFRTDISVPPLEFMQETVLLYAKACLSDSGLLVLNVIPTDKSVYADLKHLLKGVFEELYEMHTGNGDNLVVIATMSPISLLYDKSIENAFLTKLRSVTSTAFMDTIQQI